MQISHDFVNAEHSYRTNGLGDEFRRANEPGTRSRLLNALSLGAVVTAAVIGVVNVGEQLDLDEAATPRIAAVR